MPKIPTKLHAQTCPSCTRIYATPKPTLFECFTCTGFTTIKISPETVLKLLPAAARVCLSCYSIFPLAHAHDSQCPLCDFKHFVDPLRLKLV